MRGAGIENITTFSKCLKRHEFDRSKTKKKLLKFSRHFQEKRPSRKFIAVMSFITLRYLLVLQDYEATR